MLETGQEIIESKNMIHELALCIILASKKESFNIGIIHFKRNRLYNLNDQDYRVIRLDYGRYSYLFSDIAFSTAF